MALYGTGGVHEAATHLCWQERANYPLSLETEVRRGARPGQPRATLWQVLVNTYEPGTQHTCDCAAVPAGRQQILKRFCLDTDRYSQSYIRMLFEHKYSCQGHSIHMHFPAAGKIVSGEHWLDDEGRRIQVQCPATIDACIQPVHPSQK